MHRERLASHPLLLDTSRVLDPAVAVELDATLPAGRLILFTLEKSKDLTSWQPLAEKVLFQSGESTGILGSPAIAFPSADLGGHHVRITWSAQPHLAGPVTVSAARVRTAKRMPAPRPAVAAITPEPLSPHEVHLVVPFATPIAAIRLENGPLGAIIPVSAYGRADVADPWQLMGQGVIRRGKATVELGGGSYKQLRLLADTRTPGFSGPLQMTLLFDPVELVVQFGNAAPFTLAAGLADALQTYLAVSEIMPQPGAMRLAQLPRARAAVGDAPIIVLQPIGSDRLARRSLTLWLVLALGVAVLGYAIVRLMRQQASG
ncbi:MAG: DUF3999 domain-containing protein [Novosphingobium sp.]|nr:DUF3999 domain-containing protein [Novosphingobium sp.]